MSRILKNRIVSKVKLNSNVFRITLESEYIANCAMPGQFVNVKCDSGMKTLLRRPISICSVDRSGGLYDIVFQVKGTGTGLLSETKQGDILDILGPLGNKFDYDIQYRRIAVVGGGIGIFPLLFLLNESNAPVKRSYFGFRDSESIVLKDEFEQVSSSLEITTDDGSSGTKGLVTDIFERDIESQLPDIIYACGPLPMLKRVAAIAESYDIPCQVSLEERMCCGFGACLACVCKTKNSDGTEFSRVCKDGPVFWSSKVVFDNQEDRT